MYKCHIGTENYSFDHFKFTGERLILIVRTFKYNDMSNDMYGPAKFTTYTHIGKISLALQHMNIDSMIIGSFLFFIMIVLL